MTSIDSTSVTTIAIQSLRRLADNCLRPRSLRQTLLAGLGGAGVAVSMAFTAPATHAQDACCFQPAYRLQCDTVLEPRVETAYRTRYQTVPEVRDVTETRYVLKTRTEEREIRVAKPVVKTAYREETYTVMKPVLETSLEKRQRTRTRMVTETSERVQQVTSYRPVVETQMRSRQYQVQRPVTETMMQTQAYTTLRPVATMESRLVDAGGYVPQQVVTPGSVNYGLQWVPRAYQTTGPLGILSVNRGGLFWTPQVTPPTVQTQLAYRPNFVNQQVARTQYVPETVQQQVPVQTTRMVTETVSEQVPVQTTRMEAVTEERRIPVTVQRPETETYVEEVPVQRYRYVAETKTRRIPVTTTETVYETRSEPVQIQYYEPETFTRQVTVNRVVPVTEEYTRTVMVARPRIQRVAPSYYDPFGESISSGYSSLMPPVIYPGTSEIGSSVLGSSVLTPTPAETQKPKAGITGMNSKLTGPDGDEEEQSPSDVTTPAAQSEQPADEVDNGSDDNGQVTEPSDEDPIDPPALTGAGNSPVLFRMRGNSIKRQPREA